MLSNKNRTTYVVEHKNRQIKLDSSSGGVFSLLAEYVLEQNGAVVGAAYSKQMECRHYIIKNKEELYKLRGSKYVQSSLYNVYDEIIKLLLNNEMVLFCGTPCQVDAIKSVCIAKSISMNKLILVDLICHGVQSPRVFKDYLIEVQRDGNKIIDYKFRSKRNGWHSHTEDIIYDEVKKETRKEKWLKYSWLTLFGSYHIYRDSCTVCPYCSLDRVSDITIGDAWGIENISPEIDDNTGLSLVLLNTEKGAEVFKCVQNNANVYEYDIELLLQPRINNIPCPKPKDKEEFWKLYNEKGFICAIKKYGGYNFGEHFLYYVKIFLRKCGITKYIKKLMRK